MYPSSSEIRSSATPAQTSTVPPALDAALTLHRQAADDLAQAVEAISEKAWSTPLGEGRWTPAQVCKHLNLAYEVLIDELDGGPGMKILPALWQRVLLRTTMLPKLLRGGPFPKVRAPREIRPSGPGAPEIPGADVPRAEALAELRDLAGRFDERVRQTHQTNPKAKLSHAYFGRSSLAKSVVLCSRHIQHHWKQLVP